MATVHEKHRHRWLTDRTCSVHFYFLVCKRTEIRPNLFKVSYFGIQLIRYEENSQVSFIPGWTNLFRVLTQPAWRNGPCSTNTFCFQVTNLSQTAVLVLLVSHLLTYNQVRPCSVRRRLLTTTSRTLLKIFDARLENAFSLTSFLEVRKMATLKYKTWTFSFLMHHSEAAAAPPPSQHTDPQFRSAAAHYK